MLRRYLLAEVFLPYLLGVLLFVGLITTDLLSSLSGVLLARGTPWSEIAWLVVYRLPYTLGVALPLGLVFAILVGISRLVRDSELKAAYAGGVPPLSLLPPLLLLSLVVAAVVFANAAWIKPEAQARFEKKLYALYYGSEPSGVLYRQGYAPEGLGVFFAERIYPGEKGGRLEGVRVVEPSGVVWSADQGVWAGRAWVLEEAWRVEGTKVERWPKAALTFPARYVPRYAGRNYEALPLAELAELARVDPRARFSLMRRVADAFGVVVLAWLATVIGLGLREAVWAFAAVVLVIFGYYVLWTLAARLAGVALVGAWGAWLPDGVYALLAVWGTVRLR